MKQLEIERHATEARIALGGVLDVRQARRLYETLQPLLDENTAIAIDGGDVTRVDTAALQLVTAFCRSARASARQVHWTQASAELRRATALLGLEQELGITA